MCLKKCLKIFVFCLSKIIFFLVLGCAKENLGMHEVYNITKNGKDVVESESIEVQRGRCGRAVIQKQHFYEKTCCIGPDGKKIRAKGQEACIKAGGKLVDEVLIQEELINR